MKYCFELEEDQIEVLKKIIESAKVKEEKVEETPSQVVQDMEVKSGEERPEEKKEE